MTPLGPRPLRANAGILLLTPGPWAGKARPAQLSIPTSLTLISVGCPGAKRIGWPSFNQTIHSWWSLWVTRWWKATRRRGCWRRSARRGMCIKRSPSSPSPAVSLLLSPSTPLSCQTLCCDVTEDTAFTPTGHAHPPVTRCSAVIQVKTSCSPKNETKKQTSCPPRTV